MQMSAIQILSLPPANLFGASCSGPRRPRRVDLERIKALPCAGQDRLECDQFGGHRRRQSGGRPNGNEPRGRPRAHLARCCWPAFLAKFCCCISATGFWLLRPPVARSWPILAGISAQQAGATQAEQLTPTRDRSHATDCKAQCKFIRFFPLLLGWPLVSGGGV